MAIAEHDLAFPGQVDTAHFAPLIALESVTDAQGLDQLHADLYGSALLNQDGSATFTHEDDESIRFVIGFNDSSKFFKLGEIGISSLVYTVRDERVFQTVGIDGSPPREGPELTDHTLEITALANFIKKGRQ